ncbi:prepilin-type N-terminal cleavage/methylation domain-containing protein [Diaphorobacter aerolatus]|uniref:Prepilin-type N-terminal cleavage/methylation domain-containing protein n=1 Tax=Diaphorobacter aerolatus TaxID=1288495 RepID=A0A7H0GQA5_9BURK|nr:prepilin-type N-terminal cleavage/methylation domain-containing protein [Diaphorobacter aerolatus]
MRGRVPSRRRVRGFSLLELLVAFAIMAISLGVLYRATGSSVRTVGDLDLRQQATSIAESTISRVDAVPTAGLNESGAVGDIAWSLQTQPYDSGNSAPQAPKLHELVVSVRWMDRGEPREMILRTLRPERGPRRPGI